MKTNYWRDIGDVGAVGIQFVLSLGVGYYGGQYLDRRFFGGHGYMTFIGAVIGIIAAFKAIYDVGKRAQRRLEEESKDESQKK